MIQSPRKWFCPMRDRKSPSQNTGVSFSNERQKVEISLKKLLEQNETFGVGGNEEWKKTSPLACSFRKS